ncbi:MAG: glycosyltransferase family 2 protein [Elusimicrobia bacterium]|nr:glycosyltransferase family 2 protein [Elusimicrobiota bacterium]
MLKVSIIIPAYNEEGTIAQIIERVKAAGLGGLEREIVVVDDASKDRTREILKSLPGIKVILHEKNGGKGAAVKTGFKAASGDILAIQDADLEYDPKDIKEVVRPIAEGRADAALGSRFVREKPRYFFGKPKSPFFTHYIGNLLIIYLTNFLYGYRATDYEGCYKAFSRNVIETISIKADGFEYDNELICKILRRGWRLAEVPITYAPRTYEAGKKIKWLDGMRMIWTIVKWRFLPF